MIKVLKPGFYSTIQDLGRFGFQHYGVPTSGVMDRYSAKLGNAILTNYEDDAVLEITMTGPTLQFYCDTQICVSGADMSPRLNDVPVGLHKVIIMNAGDVLSFGKLKYGFRCYLAVFGGFQSNMAMKSRSMYHDITSCNVIKKEQELQISEQAKQLENSNSSIKIDDTHFTSNGIEVLKGPEHGLLSDKQKQQLVSQTFTVSKNNNRMAYQLDETIDNNLKPILTSFVLPGTVQLTPSGKLIILMRDCQTTGGYPRILQLKEASINIVSQKVTGGTLHFRVKG